MATNPTIQFKRKTTSGTPSSLSAGEPAVNTADNQLFIGVNGPAVKWIGAEIENSSTNGSTWSSDLKLATKKAVGDYFMPLGGGLFSGDITLTGGSDLRFRETGGGTDYVAFQAPSSVATSVTWTLPGADGSANQVLATNGSGTLSWADAGTATTVSVSNDDTSTTAYINFTTGTSGSQSVKTDSDGITYNASTDTLTLAGDINVNGGDLITSALTASLFNTNATTVNIAGAASSGVSIGNASGAVTVAGDLAVTGGDITTSSVGTATVFNSNATTVNIGGGASSGMNIGNAAGAVTIAGDLAVAGGDITTSSTGTATIFNGNATTVNIGGGATSGMSIGNASGPVTIAGDLSVAGGDITTSSTGTATVFNGNATTVNIGGGATSGVSIGNAASSVTIAGDLAVTGADITTSATGTATVFNTNATTLNMGGVATTVTIGSNSSGTTTVRHNLTASGDMNVASTKVYKVNGTEVLSATALGSGVVSSSLTSVGTIASGTWNGTTIAVANGGTGTTTGSITGSGALTFTAGGSNTNVNLVPNGTGTVDVASKKITNLQTPTVDTDAATKKYVDDVAQGLHMHATANAATTAKLSTLAGATVSYSSGTQAITWTGGTALTSTFTDGQSFTASTTESAASRLLVKNEGDASGLGSQYNGVYYCYGARELRRASDGNVAADWVGGDFVFVLAGTLYNNTGWVQTEKVTTLDTDPILWEQFSGAGTFTADEVTLTRSGTQFSIKNTYVGQASITTVGTLTSGTLGTGFTTVATSVGGTGLTSFTSGGALYATSTSALTTGTLPVASGGTGITSFGIGVATWLGAPSSANLAAAVTDETGSGSLVFANSPTLVTPTLGVASATTINKVTITAPATGSTLTIANGKTLSVSNTLTFTGTDSSSVAFGGGGTVAYTANKLSVFAATSSSELAGVISDETGTGALVFASSPSLTTPAIGSGGFTIAGSSSGTTTFLATAAASGTITFPAVTGTVITTANLSSIGNAAADGSTKGLATFNSTQFDDSSGLITLDTIDGGTYA
jgi:hypothetical protein